jgi:hypothetical protein
MDYIQDEALAFYFLEEIDSKRSDYSIYKNYRNAKDVAVNTMAKIGVDEKTLARGWNYLMERHLIEPYGEGVNMQVCMTNEGCAWFDEKKRIMAERDAQTRQHQQTLAVAMEGIKLTGESVKMTKADRPLVKIGIIMGILASLATVSALIATCQNRPPTPLAPAPGSTSPAQDTSSTKGPATTQAAR